MQRQATAGHYSGRHQDRLQAATRLVRREESLRGLDAVKAFVVGARLGEPTFGLPQFQHDPSPWATLGVPSRALGISLILRRTGCRIAGLRAFCERVGPWVVRLGCMGVCPF